MKGKALEGIKQIREPNYREELVPLKVKDTYEYIIVFSHKRCKVIILNEVMAFLLIFKEKIQINYVK